MVVHDLRCDSCGKVEPNYVFRSMLDADHPPLCPCGGSRHLHYSPSYSRTFGGSWNGLSRDKITVFEHPDGRVEFPGRTDLPMPERYHQQGFVRRELAPFEVSAFEKRHGVICEPLHWDNNGKADREDPVPPVPTIPPCNLLD